MLKPSKEAKPDTSQTEAAYARLRTMIINCELAPGSRLTERELIERLGLGRTPVREALVRLDQDRLIETLPRSGYRVTRIDRKSIEDFFTVWLVLGPLTAKLAYERMAADDRQELMEIGVKSANPALRPSELASNAAEFFNRLATLANNDLLLFLYERLSAEMERLFINFFNTEQGRQWVSTAEEIAAFVAVRDPGRASAIIEERVSKSKEGILFYFQALDTMQPSEGFTQTAATRRKRRSKEGSQPQDKVTAKA